MVLARVGDEVVTVEDLGFIPVTVNLTNKLETLVMRKLAAEEARRRGLAEEPKTREKLAQFRNQRPDVGGRAAPQRPLQLDPTRHDLQRGGAARPLRGDQNRYTAPQWKLRIQKFASEAEARAAAEKLGATGRLDPAQGESLGSASPPSSFRSALLPVLPLLKQPGDRQVLDLEGAVVAGRARGAPSQRAALLRSGPGKSGPGSARGPRRGRP